MTDDGFVVQLCLCISELSKLVTSRFYRILDIYTDD